MGSKATDLSVTKIFGGIAIVAVAVVIGLNVKIISNSNNAIPNISFVETEGLASETSEPKTGQGKKEESSIKCTIMLSVTTTEWVEGDTNMSVGLGASASVPTPYGNFGVTGNYGSGGSNATGHWKKTTEFKITEIKGIKIGCSGTQASYCSPYGLCA